MNYERNPMHRGITESVEIEIQELTPLLHSGMMPGAETREVRIKRNSQLRALLPAVSTSALTRLFLSNELVEKEVRSRLADETEVFTLEDLCITNEWFCDNNDQKKNIIELYDLVFDKVAAYTPSASQEEVVDIISYNCMNHLNAASTILDQTLSHRSDTKEVVDKVIERGKYIPKPYQRALEEELYGLEIRAHRIRDDRMKHSNSQTVVL